MKPHNMVQTVFFGQTVPVTPEVTPEWRRWVAENVLLRVPHQSIAQAMMRDGFDAETAAREIQAAESHPYVVAARGVGARGTTNADAKIEKRDWILEIYRRSARQASTFGRVTRVRKPSRQ